MPINTKTFTTYVTDQVTSIQARSSQLVNFTIGSVLRALVETNAAIALWFQGMIVALLATTRAATSNSSDLDAWMADFGLTRLPAVAAKGNVTFARFTATAQAVIPIGAVVQTADGSQLFTVVIDVANGAYSAGLGGYVMGIGTTNVTVPVVANVLGSAGNVLANPIKSLTQSITFVDTVTNASHLTAGSYAEADAALRAR
ncbi:MAG: baseplate J/gp47 family protein, partial [Burkholderiaceae bacterium]|nr:baseplate J/gp47 family protein [Burkholderiaceae bacterium]